MVLNLFFFQISIKKRNVSIEEYVHEEQVKMMYEEMKEKQRSMMNFY
ncbi:YrzI family small protein [Bacillus sp. PS06]|nr:YrzI family small protein [Bacillus sp. PS06]MBD8069239.1 YrzI family small protein [Bacillus sp. PS06]